MKMLQPVDEVQVQALRELVMSRWQRNEDLVVGMPHQLVRARRAEAPAVRAVDQPIWSPIVEAFSSGVNDICRSFSANLRSA